MALGVFFAAIHAAWQALVWLGSAGKFMVWILSLHSIKMSMTITAFNATTAVTLIIVTFVFGYVFGWVFSLVWNRFRK